MSGGSLDPAFGTGGVAKAPIGTPTTRGGVALQADGKVVAAVSTVGAKGTADFGLARFNSNGTLDTAFGSGGTVTTDLGGNEQANAVAIQPDGKILLAGSTDVGNNVNFAVVRYNPNGTIDTTFGSSGVANVDLGASDVAYSMVLDSNGNIDLAGSSGSAIGLTRLTPAGKVDTAFGKNGVVVTPASGIGYSLSLQSNGDLVVGGQEGSKAAVLRFLPSGTLDAGFGTNGTVLASFSGQTANSLFSGVAIQPNGQIVAAGQADVTGGRAAVLERFNTNGSPDTGFGTNGQVETSFGTTATVNGVVLQGDGKIDIAGYTVPQSIFLVARYNPDGTLDTTFGNKGSVTAPSGSANAIAITPDSTQLYVAGITTTGGSNLEVARYFTGNPSGDFSFSATVFNGSEAGGSATITVSRQGGSQGTVTVNYATSDGTARAGVQYTATSGMLTFGPGEPTKTFTVPILKDNIIDGTTTVNLTLSNPTGGAGLGSQATAVLKIQDAPGSLAFSSATYTATQSDGQATITVTRTIGNGGPVTVNYATGGGTAVPNVDYVPTSGTLLLNDGQLTGSFSIKLLGNPLASGIPTVGLNLSQPGGGASLGTPSTAVLQILVTPGAFAFSSSIYSAQEGRDPAATIIVTRLGGSDGTASVNYATSDGTATAGVNYTPASGTLTFGPGVTTQTFTVPILVDNTVDGNLGVNLTLSNPTGGASLGGRSNATLVIVDQPGTLQFGQPNYDVAESAGVAYVSVLRSVGVGGLVAVNYATADGTAKAGVDYLPTSGTLVFGPGETAKLLAIPILNDGKVDGINKAVRLTLSNAALGASLGAQSIATVTILDSHQPGTIGDYLAKGKTDLAVFRTTTGQLFIRGVGALPVGQPGDIPVPGVYDGFKLTEAAVYRPSAGTWIIDGLTGPRAVPFGAPNLDLPVPADYDGDGKTDIAVYRPITGQWFILGSTLGVIVQSFGAPTDKPIPGDYDGDGRADIAVYRPSTGQWFIDGSSAGVMVRQFGAPNLDLPVPADYDGDGKIDLAIFRPTTDQWLILYSSGGYKIAQFGRPRLDIPVPGDYDGDGKADLAVFRPTTDQWAIAFSKGGGQVLQFGAPGIDVPAQPPQVLLTSNAGTLIALRGGSDLALLGALRAPGAEAQAAFALASTPRSADTGVLDQALDALGNRKNKAEHRVAIAYRPTR